MNALCAIVLRVYKVLLHIYPNQMQHEFAAEMHAVAAARLTAAQTQGRPRFVLVAIHEVGGLVLGAALAWWHRLRRGPWQLGPMRAALLPVLLLGTWLLPWDVWRWIPSYFCDHANPQGGSRANQVACRLTTQPLDVTPWVMYAALATVVVVLLMRRGGWRTPPRHRSS